MNEHWKPGMSWRLVDPEPRQLKEAILAMCPKELATTIINYAKLKTSLSVQFRNEHGYEHAERQSTKGQNYD